MSGKPQKPIANPYLSEKFAMTGKKYSEIAKEIGVSRQELNNYLHSPGRTSKTIHKKLADYFNVDYALWIYQYTKSDSTKYSINISLDELNQVHQI